MVQTVSKKATLNDFFALHFPCANFNGRVIIGGRRKIAVAPYQIKAVPIKNLIQTVQDMQFVHQDYYITANTFSGVTRNKENLFALHNIVIDIDCHDEVNNMHSPLLNALISRLYRDVFNANLLPMPNTIVHTGRGLQLWWAIKPLAVACINSYTRIKTHFMNTLQELLNEYPTELSRLSLDAGATSNAVGYFRMPGTYNTRSSSYGHYSIEHTDVIDLISMISLLPKKETPHKANAECFLMNNPFTLGLRRAEQMYKLRRHRDAAVGHEQRNNLSFIVYNSLLSTYSEDVAYDKLCKFNSGFKKPLTEVELRSCISTSKRINGYKLTNAWIIRQLGITQTEQKEIDIKEFTGTYQAFLRVPNARRDAQAKERKEKRNNTIIKLAQQGYKQKDIADKIGCCPATVKSVLEKAFITRKNTNEKVLMLQKTHTVKQIAEILKLSTRTIQRTLKYLKEKKVKQAIIKQRKMAFKFVRICGGKRYKFKMRQKPKNPCFICFDLLSIRPPG